MTNEPSATPDGVRSKKRARVLGVVAFVALAAGLVWRFIWPWTGERTDLIFLCVTVVGLLAGAAAGHLSDIPVIRWNMVSPCTLLSLQTARAGGILVSKAASDWEELAAERLDPCVIAAR